MASILSVEDLMGHDAATSETDSNLSINITQQERAHLFVSSKIDQHGTPSSTVPNSLMIQIENLPKLCKPDRVYEPFPLYAKAAMAGTGAAEGCMDSIELCTAASKAIAQLEVTGGMTMTSSVEVMVCDDKTASDGPANCVDHTFADGHTHSGDHAFAGIHMLSDGFEFVDIHKFCDEHALFDELTPSSHPAVPDGLIDAIVHDLDDPADGGKLAGNAIQQYEQMRVRSDVRRGTTARRLRRQTPRRK